jgi:aspartate carbamoyltransferase catalytic subunit
LSKHKIKFREENDLHTVLPTIDIVYMTRIQKERISIEDYEKARGKFIINEETLALIRENARILHPLPHVEEIDLPVKVESKDARVAYFRQSENGLYIRMALLKHLLKEQ